MFNFPQHGALFTYEYISETDILRLSHSGVYSLFNMGRAYHEWIEVVLWI